MPVNAWVFRDLFPVKEKPVTEKKDNSVSYGVVGGTASFIGWILGIACGIFLSGLIKATQVSQIRDIVVGEVNERLNEASLVIFYDKLKGLDSNTDTFDIDVSKIKEVVKQQEHQANAE
jgi:hypothetical protein